MTVGLLLAALSIGSLLPGCGAPQDPAAATSAAATSAVATPDANDSPSPAELSAAAADIPGIYAETSGSGIRLLLCDDGRCKTWDATSKVWSAYEVATDVSSVTVGEVGTLTWDAGAGVLVGADIGRFQQLAGDVGRVARGTLGKTIEELERELDAMEDELDEEVMRQLGDDEEPAPPPQPATVSVDDVVGTYGKSGEDYTVTLRADGTYESGVGLAYDCGTFVIEGLQVVFREDPAEDLSTGSPACGSPVTFDPASQTLRDQWGGTWQPTAPQEEDLYKAF